MVLAIAGGRDFTDWEGFKEIMKGYEGTIEKIVSGGRRKDGKGVDTLAIRWAIENNVPYEESYPNWELHGKAAGPIRSKEFIDKATYFLGIWDGKSKGTKASIDIARKAGKKVTIVEYGND